MWIFARATLVVLVILFYAAMGTCLLLIQAFEDAWDRGDPVVFPERCRGITSDPGIRAAFAVLGILIGLILCVKDS
jgi:hypothetical protein